jgi:Tol biopolymer transport system component
LGTAAYMSPEQIRGEKLDARTDLFSFGLVLYEMATGKPAFAGDTIAAVHEGILRRAAKPVRESDPEVTPKLDDIISKALEKGRGFRYQTASDLCTDLKRLKRETDSGRVAEAFSQSQTALEGATTWAQQAAPVRRWPVWLGASVAVVLVGVAVGWLFRHQQQSPSPPTERQITANPLEDWVRSTAISPDGKYVAYLDQTGVYLRSTDSGDTHALSLPQEFEKRLYDLRWLPDGGRLLAVANDPGPQMLWLITALGESRPRLLYQDGIMPAFSPDGQSVAFVNCCGEPWLRSIRVGDIDGQPTRDLAVVKRDERLLSPAWSPDGRWIAYARILNLGQTPQQSVIEVRPARGGPPKGIVSEASLPKSRWPCFGPASIYGCMVWSPDWRLIFAAGQAPASPSAQPKYSLWEVQTKPGTVKPATPRQLTRWSDFEPTDLTITADGKRLSFLKQRSWEDVYLADLGAGGRTVTPPRRFTLDNRGIDSLDSWTPDSQAVFFTSSRNGKAEVFRKDLRDTVSEAVVRGRKDDHSARLTADGSWLLYVESTPAVGTEAALDRIMRRPVAGGPAEILLQEPAEEVIETSSSWDYKCPRKPGLPCVLSEKHHNDLVFYSLDPVRGRGRQLAKMKVRGLFGYDWDISPDGSRLAAIGKLNGEGKIQVLSIRNRTWHEVSPKPPLGFPIHIAWAADGEGFFVTSNAPQLLHVTLSGRAEQLIGGKGGYLQRSLASPDGKHLAYEAVTNDSNVWMLEKF